jgi:hypothetical protein
LFDPRKILQALNAYKVQYVIVGGVAATLHGYPEQTFDLEILYADTSANRARLLQALQAIEAHGTSSSPNKSCNVSRFSP